VEDGLSPEERKAFDRHVAMCHACRAYVESYARTIELEGLAFEDPEALALSDVPEELVQGILAARRLRVTGDSRRAARAAQEALRPRREAGGRS
jgi:predicted anti-sigma-YlaC factor YlaD